MKGRSSFIVAQLGARTHYAVPRILHRAGTLGHFYTDICAVKGWPKLLGSIPEPLRPMKLKKLLDRMPQGIPAEKITAFTKFGREYYRRRMSASTPSEITATHLWAGKTFCQLAIEKGFGEANGVYTFNSAGLELLQAARSRELRTVMEQTIVPREVEEKLLSEERAAFPDWEGPSPRDDKVAEFMVRERAEWEIADIILCGSEFVKNGISASGGPVERCRIVPYGVDAGFSLPPRRPHQGPLRVLTVGVIGLRKGSPYVLEAAKRLRGRAHFRMVGPIAVSPIIEKELRTVVELIGPVPRSGVMYHYAWADVFLLPSLCEGSATVTYEAMAAGLPVICTPNTGSVVRDGVEGFIVPVRDSESIVKRMEEMMDDRTLREHLSENARQRREFITLSAYAERLIDALGAGGER